MRIVVLAIAALMTACSSSACPCDASDASDVPLATDMSTSDTADAAPTDVSIADVADTAVTDGPVVDTMTNDVPAADVQDVSATDAQDVSATDVSTDTPTSDVACMPITNDGSAVGNTCTTGSDCPAGYTCKDMIGFVDQHLCEILCTRDCDCPSGLHCVMAADKAGSWYQCG